MNAYHTHQPYTKSELEKLCKKSKVLELGLGFGSSPLMYEFCKNNPNSTVQAFETDADWFNQINNQFGGLTNYTLTLISSWNEIDSHLKSKNYDLVFVDQAPWEARIETIDLLKTKTKVFILHDYDYFNKSEHLWVKNPCNNIYINDETSWLGQSYSDEFIMEDNYETLPPTLIMRKK